MTGDFVTLGKVVGVYGVKGWVKIQSFTAPLENIFNYPDWTLSLPDGSVRQMALREGRAQGKGLVAALSGITDREVARDLIGTEIRVSKDQLPPLEADEYYWHQLEGLQVRTSDGQNLGSVDHLMETGANDVLVVKATIDSIDDRERLIPYLPGDVVRQISLDQGHMEVDWDPEF